MRERTIEETYGPGPVGGSRPLNAPGPNGPGTLPTFRAIRKADGVILICDDRTFDPDVYERVGQGGAA